MICTNHLATRLSRLVSARGATRRDRQRHSADTRIFIIIVVKNFINISKNVTSKIENGAQLGHLVNDPIRGVCYQRCEPWDVFEKPKECAEISVEWLTKTLKTWGERRKYERNNRDNKSVNRITLSDEWIKRCEEGFRAYVAKQKSKL